MKFMIFSSHAKNLFLTIYAERGEVTIPLCVERASATCVCGWFVPMGTVKADGDTWEGVEGVEGGGIRERRGLLEGGRGCPPPSTYV